MLQDLIEKSSSKCSPVKSASGNHTVGGDKRFTRTLPLLYLVPIIVLREVNDDILLDAILTTNDRHQMQIVINDAMNEVLNRGKISRVHRSNVDIYQVPHKSE